MREDNLAVNPNRVAACRTEELRQYRLPAAVLLGSLKRGAKERQSIKKARAARLNGFAPPQPGSRPRGRPRINRDDPVDGATGLQISVK
jgi:hypothetical protein